MVEDEVVRILREEYGISTMSELDKALSKLGAIDISLFCEIVEADGAKERIAL